MERLCGLLHNQSCTMGKLHAGVSAKREDKHLGASTMSIMKLKRTVLVVACLLPVACNADTQTPPTVAVGCESIKQFDVAEEPAFAEKHLSKLLLITNSQLDSLSPGDEEFANVFSCQYLVKHKLADAKFYLGKPSEVVDIAFDLTSIDPADALAGFKYSVAHRLSNSKGVAAVSDVLSQASTKDPADRLLVQVAKALTDHEDIDCSSLVNASDYQKACLQFKQTGEMEAVPALAPATKAAVLAFSKLEGSN